MKTVAGTLRCASNPSSRGTPVRGPYSHCDIRVRRRASEGSSESAVVSPSTSKQSIAAQRFSPGQTKRGRGEKRSAGAGRSFDLIAGLREFDQVQFFRLRLRRRMDVFLEALFE